MLIISNPECRSQTKFLDCVGGDSRYYKWMEGLGGVHGVGVDDMILRFSKDVG